MNKTKLVSIAQAKQLKKLGFNIPVSHYTVTFLEEDFSSKFITEDCPEDWNNKEDGLTYLSIPTKTEAIDWLIDKKGIIKCEDCLILNPEDKEYRKRWNNMNNEVINKSIKLLNDAENKRKPIRRTKRR